LCPSSAGLDLEAEGLAGGDVGRAGGEHDEVVEVGVVGEAGLEGLAALGGVTSALSLTLETQQENVAWNLRKMRAVN